MRYLTPLLFFSFLFNACAPDEMPEPVLPESVIELDSLKVVWQRLKMIDGFGYACRSMNPYVVQDKVLFSERYCPDGDKVECYNGETGMVLWEWETTPFPKTLNLSFNPIRHFDKHILFSTRSNWFVVDSESGNMVESYDLPNKAKWFRFIDNLLYRTESDHVSGPHDIQLIRTNLETGLSERVLGLQEIDGFRPGQEAPSLYIHPTSLDSILIFEHHSYHSELHLYNCFVSAYNLNQDTFLWQQEKLLVNRYSSDTPPIVQEDKVYFQRAWEIYCLEAATGKLVWQNQTGTLNDLSQMKLSEGKLIVAGKFKDLTALDANTGEIIWQQPAINYESVYNIAQAQVDNIVIYQGKIYLIPYKSGLLTAVDLQTGEILWAKESPNLEGVPTPMFLGGVALNPSLGYLYVSDLNYAMCIDIND